MAGGVPQSRVSARGLATDKIADLDRQIAQLLAMRAGLARLVATCEQPHEQCEFPIPTEIATTPR